MKQKFFLSFVAIALGIASVSAQTGEKLIVNAGNTENIFIGSDMNVVLLPGTYTDRSISLNAEASENLNLKLSNNAMTIALKQAFTKEKLTVYMYVNNLKTLTVENNSTVNTIGALKTSKVDLFIDGEAKVHLITTGAINAYSLTGSEIDIKYLSDKPVAKQ